MKPRKALFIWLEEGHTVFPLGAFRSNKYAESTRLLSVGRNIGVRMGVITQFASLISKDAMKFMKQRYFGFSEEPNDIEYISEFIGSEKAKELRNLENGQFVYNYNGSKTVQIEPYIQRTEPQPIEPIRYAEQPKQPEASKPILGYIFICFIFIGLLMLINAVFR